MRIFLRTILVMASVAILCGGAAPAYAQATRTWVSGVGDDVNPCSRTAPCKTFAGAISKTATEGEINCLDSGGFGAVTITKSLTIRCDGVIGGILAAGTTGITVNDTGSASPGTARVVIDGLDIEGAGSGIHGINVVSAAKVMVVRTSIRNFTQNGINMNSSAVGGHLFVNDSFIMSNAGGVNVAGPSNIGSLTNTSVLANTSFAVQANSSTAIIGLQTSTLNDSPVGISRVAGALVISVGPSNLITGAGTISGTLLFQ